jgi:hypothetical protein
MSLMMLYPYPWLLKREILQRKHEILRGKLQIFQLKL